MPQMPGPYLVFDVGGTWLRAALYDPARDVLLAQARAATASRWSGEHASPEELLDQLVGDLARLAAEVGAPARPRLVAVGFPAPIDPRGRAFAVPTVLGPAAGPPVPVADMLAGAWPGACILVLNDVTAAGFALLDRPGEDLCVVTVSSGVGLKVFAGGRPVVGPNGRGGEIGHLVVDPRPDANRCECGGRGHLAAVASGRGVALSARRRARTDPDAFRASAVGGADPSSLDTDVLAPAFHDGDAWVAGLVGESAAALGAALAGVHVVTGVERIVLVGGFAVTLGEPYRRMVTAAAAASCWDLGQCWEGMVELRDLDGRAGLLGAGRYARAEQARPVA